MRPWLASVAAVAGREFRAYFATPLALVFIIVFLAAAGSLTFFVGQFFARGQADLRVFFGFHPWLYLVFVPAVAMRLWAEERRSGTIELLLTQPLTPAQAVIGKLLAGWAFLAVALAGTLPLWATVAWLGDPDHGVIVAGYLGSLAMAGAYLALGSALSALTRSQVTAFVLAVVAAFLVTVAGSPAALALAGDAAPPALTEALAGISFLSRFDRIGRGVLDLRDLLFYAGAIALFAWITVLAVDARGAVWRRALAGGLAAILFLSGTLAAHRALEGWRIDLTADRLFTLGDTTRRVLAAIDEPIRLDLYTSASLGQAGPALAGHAGRVREVLDEYVAAADGRLVLVRHDPAPFSEAEDAAVEAGLTGAPAGPGGEPVYLGLAARNAVDQRDTIPLFRPDRAAELEADLTRLIAWLAEPEPPRVGVLTTLPLAGGAGPSADAALRPFAVWAEIRRAFRAELLPTDTAAIDPDFNALLVVHPKDLAPATRYAVDQYLMAGGRAAVFVDPWSEAEARRTPPAEIYRPRRSDLGPWAASWGLALAPDVAVADPRAAMPVNAGTRARPQPMPYLAWLSLGRPNLDREDPVTARLDTLTLGSAGILQGVAGAGTTVEPLVVSSPEAAPVPVEQVGETADPASLLRSFVPGDRALLMAARVTGPADSAYPDGPPEAATVPDGGHRAQSAAPLDLIVVADTDILDDRFWQRPAPGTGEAVAFADNAAFLINALEDLAGGPDLSALRGGAAPTRPFDRIEALRLDAEQRLRATEQRLVQRLSEAEQALAEARSGDAADPDLRDATLDDLRDEALAIRAELRAVRRALREDVARLESRLTWLNIAGVPALLVVLALIVAAVRRLRRRSVLGPGRGAAP